jgi:hypothetical protein
MSVYEFRFQRGTSSRWTQLNPILGAGEPGVETDTGKFKIGDGTTPWVDLEYFINEAGVIAIVDDALAGGGGGTSDPRVGDMNDLSTADKATLVGAINEVNEDQSLLLLYDNAKAG